MIDARKCRVFFDFDNTIACYDVFDDLVERFSPGDGWQALEEKWREGKIGSRECLEGQLKGVRVEKNALDHYLGRVKIDPYFKKSISLLSRKKIKAIVLSDNFDYFLKQILSSHSLSKVKLYCNRLRWQKGKFEPEFPFGDKSCKICAHCKKKNLLANTKSDSIIIYIGDGRSDICAAQYADIIFAKEDLLAHYRAKTKNCFSYKSLKTVYDYLRRSIA